MNRVQINRIDAFGKFLKKHRIVTLEVPTLGTWQASTRQPIMASARGKTEWLAVRNLARRLGILEAEQL